MRNSKLHYALSYSTFESLMFNLGSILTWSIAKIYLADNEFLNLCFGLITGSFFLLIATSYKNFLDNKKI